MGYMKNQCVVVSGEKTETTKIQAVAKYIYGKVGFESLVGDVITHVTNGGASFFVSPDGSKEGWADSDASDEARAELLLALKKGCFDWVELTLGGDDNGYVVTQSPRDELDAE